MAEVIYIVHLNGLSKLCVPGATNYVDQAIEKGKEIANAIQKPLIEKPKVGFVFDIFKRLT